jgi:hypothetical protein
MHLGPGVLSVCLYICTLAMFTNRIIKQNHLLRFNVCVCVCTITLGAFQNEVLAKFESHKHPLVHSGIVRGTVHCTSYTITWSPFDTCDGRFSLIHFSLSLSRSLARSLARSRARALSLSR